MNYTANQVANALSATYAYLEVSQKGNVLTLTLNRPDKRNAMNPRMMAEIAFVLAYAHYTPEVWAVVLRANGSIFCAGADLKSFAGIDSTEPASSIPDPTGEVLLGELFVQVHKPTIAMVAAPVYAGGHLLVGGCTYVIAVEEASFGLPEVKRGLYPMQVMATLLQTLPARKVLDWCIRGQNLTARQAYELGLVTHLTNQDKMEAVLETLLAEILVNSPTAIRMGLQAYDELRSQQLHQAHAYLRGMLDQVLQTEDATEGLAAFREKRKPKWTGR